MTFDYVNSSYPNNISDYSLNHKYPKNIFDIIFCNAYTLPDESNSNLSSSLVKLASTKLSIHERYFLDLNSKINLNFDESKLLAENRNISKPQLVLHKNKNKNTSEIASLAENINNEKLELEDWLDKVS